MHTNFTPDFPGDASARAKFIKFEMSREEALKRNGFGSPDNNRFIDAFMRKQREIAQH